MGIEKPSTMETAGVSMAVQNALGAQRTVVEVHGCSTAVAAHLEFGKLQGVNDLHYIELPLLTVAPCPPAPELQHQ